MERAALLDKGPTTSQRMKPRGLGSALNTSMLLKNGVCRGAEPLCRESEGVPQI